MLSNSGFKEKQLQYERVKAAEAKHSDDLATLLRNHGIKKEAFSLYLRAFKSEDILEVYIATDDTYSLLKTYVSMNF